MVNVFRFLLAALIAAPFTAGMAIAQTPPPQPATAGAPQKPKHHPPHQCKQTPQGCPKKKKQAQPPPPQGSPPQR
jgi:hypothetical protein